jgi:hypothetical protein
LNSDIGAVGNIAGTATSLGTKNLNSASNWLNAITSGDASKTMQALSPITSAAKKSQQTQAKTNSIFGTRSGGTTGANIASSDKLHSDITNLIGSLTGSAVSEQANLGSSLLQTGLGAYTTQADLSQQRMQNWSDSILGKGITSGVAFGESYGLNSLAGLNQNSSTSSSTSSDQW